MCEFKDTIDMQKYYNFRTALRKLYDNDTTMCGDLCCKVLEIRDKYRSVESVSIDIRGYNISVIIADGTSESKVQEIMSKIATAIGYFIVNNRNSVEPSINNDPDFDTFINAPNFIFCDIVRVGYTVTFTL